MAGRKARAGILKYSKHKSKGCGFIRYPQQPDGRRPVEYLPGAYESGEMLEAYNKSMGHWLTDKTVPPWVGNKRRTRRRKQPARTLADLPEYGPTVNDIADHYQEFYDGHYSAGEAESLKYALAHLRRCYGDLSAYKFGRRELDLVRESMIQRGNCRGYINKNINRIKGCFSRAAQRGTIPDEVPAALTIVKALRKVDSRGARDRPKVKPVPDHIIEATLEHLPEVAADMVKIMRALGRRSGEIYAMRADDIDQESDDIWVYRPKHKLTYLEEAADGHDCQEVYFSKRTIPILRKWINRGSASGHVFVRPEWDDPRNRNRATVGKPWERRAFGGLIRRVCERHGIPRWTPHQLRHSCATEIYNSGRPIAAAMLQLGHRSHTTTERYILPDNNLAQELAREIC